MIYEIDDQLSLCTDNIRQPYVPELQGPPTGDLELPQPEHLLFVPASQIGLELQFMIIHKVHIIYDM